MALEPNFYTDFDLSFNPNPLTGDVIVKTNLNAIKQALMNLILLNRFEIPFDPNAIGIKRFIFEIGTNTVLSSIRQILEWQIAKYEPRVNAKEIIVDDMGVSNSIMITIKYHVLSVNVSDSITHVIKRVN